MYQVFLLVVAEYGSVLMIILNWHDTVNWKQRLLYYLGAFTYNYACNLLQYLMIKIPYCKHNKYILEDFVSYQHVFGINTRS